MWYYQCKCLIWDVGLSRSAFYSLSSPHNYQLSHKLFLFLGARGFFLAPFVVHIQISESLKYEKSVPLGTKEIEQLTFHRTSISCINMSKKKKTSAKSLHLSTYRDCYLHCIPLLFFLICPASCSFLVSFSLCPVLFNACASLPVYLFIFLTGGKTHCYCVCVWKNVLQSAE